jgi:hypothetical protein
VSFIPLLVRLAIELDQFTVAQRGGLSIDYNEGNYSGESLLDLLVKSSTGFGSMEHHELIDEEYLSVLKQLFGMGLVKKEYICEIIFH